MDRYDGRAALEWWANRSTCLGSLDVHLTTTVVSSNWSATATALRPWTVDERDCFGFLMALDPVFTLRLADDGTILVRVTEPDGAGQLHLTEFTGD
jgi:hypothetical protein